MSTEPMNIDAALVAIGAGKKLKERITMIGIELEGGWISLPPGARVIRDGSVRNLPNPTGGPAYEVGGRRVTAMPLRERARAERRIGESTEAAMVRINTEEQIRGVQPVAAPEMQIGEIPSPPMPVSEMGVWMRRYYPQSVNETCGLHVHMSFENALHYQRLMVEAYQSTIVKYVTEWAKAESLRKDHCLWGRLRDESVYCQHKFWPDHQIKTRGKDHDQHKEGHRYTVINYCYGTTGTVECRLLPMMADAEQGVRAVQRILDITNAFLAKGKERESKHSSKVVVGDDAYNFTQRVTLSEERRSGELR